MNYTKPNDPDHQDNPADWLLTALVFSTALHSILKEGEGVVVKIKNDMKELCDYDTVLVHKSGDMIKVSETDPSLDEGQMVWLHETEEEVESAKNKDSEEGYSVGEMKVYEADLDSIRDAAFDHDINLNRGDAFKLYHKLPHDIKMDILKWGASDSLVREQIWDWIGKNKATFH